MTQLFLDCDGVLADFDSAFAAHFGHPPRVYEAQKGSNTFWRDIQHEAKDFYRHLPLMADARALYDAVAHLRPIILTGCPLGGWAEPQKLAWAAEHFPGVPMITCMSKDKRTYCRPGDILVDDYLKYRDLWEGAGGVFIHHIDAASSLAVLAALGTQPVPAVTDAIVQTYKDAFGATTYQILNTPAAVGPFPIDIGDQATRSGLAAVFAALAPAIQAVPDMRPAVADIAAERQRQINVEGWTPEHDDQHDKGELAEAASCYARGSDRVTWMQPDPEFPRHKVMTGCIIWPWDLACWKPTDRRRNLVKAGALIAAEIDRLDRATPPKPSNTN
ncbi:hypothetical protein [Mesorhizobium sp.]|uniref:hypothetical protein n=1 Tax=Mesorhizobium sp. TaxID=1871066 RepID=UPI002579445C|nr:hypothetical protein [Mesorhizobium sp.]